MEATTILVLVVLLAVTLYLLGRAVNTINWLREDLQQATDTEHAKCIGAVAAFVGDHYASQVLRVAAEDYDSVTEQGRMETIGRLRWSEDGPSMPALWLHDRADHLLALAEGESQ